MKKTFKFLTIAIAIFLTTKTYAQQYSLETLTVTNETDPIANCSHSIELMISYNYNGTPYTQISNRASMTTSGQTALLSISIPYPSTITAKKVRFTKSGGTTVIHDLSLSEGGDDITGYCANDVVIYGESTISSTTWYYFLTILFP